jgi:hypothetical protein
VNGENRGTHDRAVVRALRSLEPVTRPTTSERQRIRDRILLALDEEAGEAPAEISTTAGRPGPSAGVPAPIEHPPTATEPDDVPIPDEAAATSGSGRTRLLGRETDQQDGRERSGPGRGQAGSSRAGTRPPERHGGRRRALAGLRGRFAVAAVAVLTLVGSLVGMSVLLSRDALPGDALYGIKRTAEAAELGFTFGDEPKALKHLEFAAARISEIETLARRYPNASDAPVGSYLTALTDFDNDATAGSRQLIALATDSDGRLLESLRDWSAQQSSRLERIANQLPEAARNRQAASSALLDRITTRADTLLARMSCSQATSGSFDDIGALPASGPCEAGGAAPTSSTSAPSVAPPTDNPGSPTGPAQPGTPLPPAAPTPEVPPVPVPGATVSVPLPTGTTTPGTPPTTSTPPLIELPPLLPGLPTVSIG